MSEQLKQLQELETQLHEVNQEFARAALPLDQTDLNDEQQEKLGAQLRAVLARWESVTQRISLVLGLGSTASVSRQNTTKADRNEN